MKKRDRTIPTERMAPTTPCSAVQLMIERLMIGDSAFPWSAGLVALAGSFLPPLRTAEARANPSVGWELPTGITFAMNKHATLLASGRLFLR